MKIQQILYVFIGAIAILAIIAYRFRGMVKISKAKAYLIVILAIISTITNFLTHYIGPLLSTIVIATSSGLILFIFLGALAKRKTQ